MDFIPSAIQAYAEAHSDQETEILAQLNRETYARVMAPRMLSGHLQGRILSMLSHMICPKVVLEIGTYTGYSALCLAEGLAEGGKVITLDINEEQEQMARSYFAKAGFADKIDFRIGDAIELIPKIEEVPQLVFIDADKENYSNYYNLVINKVCSGGFIVADNVLWSGKVVSTENKTDKETQAILDFNRLVQQDDRVENVLFPVRDGLMVIRKK